MDPRLSLWWTRLEADPAQLRALAGELTEAERDRAAGFRHAELRDRFVIGRGRLRRVLARELGVAPAAVPIVIAAGGKPGLADGAIHFSDSRSEDVALYALSRTTEVGVDIEAIRADREMDGIARRFFAPAEQRALAELPDAVRHPAAVQCWTAKEAYGKVTGEGILYPLRSVVVWDAAGAPVRAGDWTVHPVAGPPGFAASVAGTWPAGWTPPTPLPWRD